MLPIYSFSYSVPYIAIAIILLFYGVKDINNINKSFRREYLFLIILLLLFLGLRGFVYTDFVSYYPFFDDLLFIDGLSSNIEDFESFEPGFILYSTIIKTLYPSYHFWVFCNTIIDLIVLYYVFKKYSPSIILSFAFFIAFQGLTIEFNLYRNSKSIMLFLLSIEYLKNRDVIPYMLLNILGCTFHISSIIYLPLYFILYRDIPKKIVYSLVIIANLMFFLKISIIESFISFVSNLNIPILTTLYKLSYHSDFASSYEFSLSDFERLFTFLLFTVFYDKLVVKNEVNKIIYNCYLLFYIFNLVFYEVVVFQQRFPVLFVFSYWFLYPSILAMNFKYRKCLKIVSVMLVLYKVYSLNTYYLSSYDNLLWGIKDFETRYSDFYLYYKNTVR